MMVTPGGFTDVMRVALRASQARRWVVDLEEPYGPRDHAILTVINALLDGLTATRCRITGALKGFGSDEFIRGVAVLLDVDVDADMLKDVRAVEFALLSVLPA